MAHTLTYQLNHGSGPVARLRRAVTDYRRYRQTVAELGALSNRELNDLGISRFAIRQVAHESVYGI
jgi:uncharacterized protein YjiS (DUF1127 family)